MSLGIPTIANMQIQRLAAGDEVRCPHCKWHRLIQRHLVRNEGVITESPTGRSSFALTVYQFGAENVTHRAVTLVAGELEQRMRRVALPRETLPSTAVPGQRIIHSELVIQPIRRDTC